MHRASTGGGRESFIEQLVKNAPEERRPNQADIAYFLGPAPFTWRFDRKEKVYREFLIAAPTAELAERRARALLTLLDQGFSRTLQLALYEKLDTTCKRLQELQAAIDKYTTEEEQLADESKQYAGFKADMLEPVRLQELQLEIELAGIKARIAGCDKVLAQPGLDAERKKNVEDLKIAAEIELLAIDARRAKAAEILAKVKESTRVAIQHAQVNAMLRKSINDYKQAANQIAKIHEEMRWFAPLPLMEDKIIVQELEFTQ
jgi:hypothetical protein